ncbi:MAG: peptidase S10, partial [Eudoraea sp.]
MPLFFLKAQEKKEDSLSVPEAKSFVTKHEIINGGKTIRYMATASETYLKNEKDKPVASIWSVAYTQEGISDFTK